MAQITLDDVVLEQEITNEELDKLSTEVGKQGKNFKKFFADLAAQRLDMLEMARELAGPKPDPLEKPSATPDKKPADESPLSPGLLAGLASLFGATGIFTLFLGGMTAIGLNSLGAVGWMGEITKGFKNLGNSLLDSKKLNTMTASLKNFFTALPVKLPEILTKIPEPITQVSGATGKGAPQAVAVLNERYLKNMAQTTVGPNNRVLGEVYESAPNARGRTTLKTVVRNPDTGKLQIRNAPKGAVIGTPEGKASAKVVESIKNAAKTAANNEIVKRVGTVVGETARVAGKILKPLAVVTAAFDGYKLQEDIAGLNTQTSIAVGTMGAVNSFVGGLGDFIKLITVDAVIEAGQFAGIVDEEGLGQRIQDFSVVKEGNEVIIKAATASAALTGNINDATYATGIPGMSVTNNVYNNVDASQSSSTSSNVVNNGGGELGSPISTYKAQKSRMSWRN
jgi:hypothetical protein